MTHLPECRRDATEHVLPAASSTQQGPAGCRHGAPYPALRLPWERQGQIDTSLVQVGSVARSVRGTFKSSLFGCQPSRLCVGGCPPAIHGPDSTMHLVCLCTTCSRGRIRQATQVWGLHAGLLWHCRQAWHGTGPSPVGACPSLHTSIPSHSNHACPLLPCPATGSSWRVMEMDALCCFIGAGMQPLFVERRGRCTPRATSKPPHCVMGACESTQMLGRFACWDFAPLVGSPDVPHGVITPAASGRPCNSTEPLARMQHARHALIHF